MNRPFPAELVRAARAMLLGALLGLLMLALGWRRSVGGSADLAR